MRHAVIPLTKEPVVADKEQERQRQKQNVTCQWRRVVLEKCKWIITMNHTTTRCCALAKKIIRMLSEVHRLSNHPASHNCIIQSWNRNHESRSVTVHSSRPYPFCGGAMAEVQHQGLSMTRLEVWTRTIPEVQAGSVTRNFALTWIAASSKTLSPFPIPLLCHAWLSRPSSGHVLLYGACKTKDQHVIVVGTGSMNRA